jgi:hypothetical protein
MNLGCLLSPELISAGETMHGANHTKGCSLDDEDEWHQFRNGSILYLLFFFISYIMVKTNIIILPII